MRKTARSSAPATEPRGGWRPDGGWDDQLDPHGSRTQGMRMLLARRREIVRYRMTPHEVAALICGAEARDLLSLFSPGTLERWASCHEWRAWALMAEYRAEECTHGAFVTPATNWIVQCGHVRDAAACTWWGGRFMPIAEARALVSRGERRPPSAWRDPSLVAQYGPPPPDPAMLERARELGITLLGFDPINASEADANDADAELDFTA